MQYTIINRNGNESLTIYLNDGDILTLDEEHPRYDSIRSFVVNGLEEDYDNADDHVRELHDVGANLAGDLRKLSEHIGYDGSGILWEGKPVNNALTRHVVRMVKDGDAYEPFVAFMEKLALNPSPMSRKYLFKWLASRDFTITEDGDILGYKAVQVSPDNLSIHSGKEKVLVNGVEHIGYIPNPIGATVEMDRSLVNPNGSHYCSVGLHIGTYDYAEQFGGGVGGRVLHVTVDPADVVSVPDDTGTKMRVSKYHVRGLTDTKYTGAVIPGSVWEDDEDINDDPIWDHDEDDEDYDEGSPADFNSDRPDDYDAGEDDEDDDDDGDDFDDALLF